MIIQVLQGVQQILVLAPVILGVWLLFFVLRFPDLTFQGAFSLGAAIFAVIATQGGATSWSALLALSVAAIGGAAAGTATGVVNQVLRVPSLLAGLGVSLCCFSISLLIMGGPTISIPGDRTLFASLLAGKDSLWGLNSDARIEHLTGQYVKQICILVGLVAPLFFLCRYLLTSRIGLILRATSENPRASSRYGINPKIWTVCGLAFGNGLVGFSGALFAQHLRFADIGFGVGLVAITLGAAVLGEAIGSSGRWSTRLWALLLGLGIFVGIRIVVLRSPAGSDLVRLIEGILLILIIGGTSIFRRERIQWDLRL